MEEKKKNIKGFIFIFNIYIYIYTIFFFYLFALETLVFPSGNANEKSMSHVTQEMTINRTFYYNSLLHFKCNTDWTRINGSAGLVSNEPGEAVRLRGFRALKWGEMGTAPAESP